MAQMKIIRIIAFQGASRSRYPEYAGEDPLIRYGHVGIQFEDDPIIYGFHPAEDIIDTIGGLETFRQLMISRTPISATFHDDTAIFQRVYELTPTRSEELLKNDPHRLEVYVLIFGFEAERYAAIHDRLKSLYNQRKEMPYLFSPITGDDPFDNCATVQRHIGIPIQAFEEHEGDIERYMDAIFLDPDLGQLWNPE